MPNNETEFQKNLSKIKMDENGVAKVVVNTQMGMEQFESVIGSYVTTAHDLGAKEIEFGIYLTAKYKF